MAKHNKAQSFMMFVINAVFLLGVVVVAQEINSRNIAPTQTVAEAEQTIAEVDQSAATQSDVSATLTVTQEEVGFWAGVQRFLESNPTLIAGTLFGLAIAAGIYGVYVFVKPIESNAYYE